MADGAFALEQRLALRRLIGGEHPVPHSARRRLAPSAPARRAQREAQWRPERSASFSSTAPRRARKRPIYRGQSAAPRRFEPFPRTLRASRAITKSYSRQIALPRFTAAKQAGRCWPCMSGHQPCTPSLRHPRKAGRARPPCPVIWRWRPARAGAGEIALIDTDPQGSLAHWWNARQAPDAAFRQGGPARPGRGAGGAATDGHQDRGDRHARPPSPSPSPGWWRMPTW